MEIVSVFPRGAVVNDAAELLRQAAELPKQSKGKRFLVWSNDERMIVYKRWYGSKVAVDALSCSGDYSGCVVEVV